MIIIIITIIITNIITQNSRLFARVVSRLEVVDLNFTKLREEQLTELLHKIKGNSQLKDLTLSSNDFLQVIFHHMTFNLSWHYS